MHSVFIGGAGRFGTILMGDLLSLCPRFSPVYEADSASRRLGAGCIAA